MQIIHEREGTNLVVYLVDELDQHSARTVIDALDRIVTLYPEESIILDLSRLTFMDSYGLAVAVNLYRSLEHNGRTLTIRHTPPQAMRVFHAAHLERKIQFIDQAGEGAVCRS